MTFNPKALDLAQIKRMSKNMQRASGQVLPEALTLTQSQELLVRAFGHENFNAARNTLGEPGGGNSRPSPEARQEGDPLAGPLAKLQLFQDMRVLVRSGMDVLRALDIIARSYEKFGLVDRAAALRDEWIPGVARMGFREFITENMSRLDIQMAVRMDLVMSGDPESIDVMDALVNQAQYAVDRDERTSLHFPMSRSTVRPSGDIFSDQV